MGAAALGDRVGSELRGGSVGLPQGAVSLGAHHPSPLAQIRLLLETLQAGRPPAPQGENTAVLRSLSVSLSSTPILLFC